jgi:hypothetical protein
VVRFRWGWWLLVGCQPQAEATWLTGYSFGWDGFNHRLSEFGVVSHPDPAVEVALVGGTSTTAIVFEDPDCVSDLACGELPLIDTSEVSVHWARATGPFGAGQFQGEVSAQGVLGTIDISVRGGAKGTPVALISGLRIDTSPASAASRSCYDPRHGWNPTAIHVAVGEPERTSRSRFAVPIEARFAAGRTLEAMRACLDEVVDEAVVGVTIDVALVFATGNVLHHSVRQQAEYDLGESNFNPDPQPPPDDASIAVEMSGLGQMGWTELSYRFHVDHPEGRGAYLRTLSFDADPAAGTAFGHATNYSPISQTSGFDYVFEGVVAEFALDGVDRFEVETTGLPTTINGFGVAQYHRLVP